MVSPVEWLQAGLVTQRTRVYQSDRDIQRGFLVGLSWKRAKLTGYILNPGATDTIDISSLSLDF